MPIDPFAALNAMLRAEVARSTPPPARRPESEDTDCSGNPPGRPAEAAPTE
ncbi:MULTISPECIES: hypothetical protein [unclassified Streptomyces]|uniref:hypothetical protein n=1 Tax=unclassified Streptomyces TaxID=2593676 RepID=UPI002E31B17E|nr:MULTISPECIES: hypothetical protein [unclassified Streptomyces]WUC65701.1 hypothetical protein OG861_16465 [Streptomyces sp. NBC_00539]